MKWSISLAVLVCIALSTGPALAQGQGVAGVGPTNPNNGYPTWYQDRQGLALEPCLVFPTDPNAPVPDPCGLVGTLPDDNSPVVFPTNFPDEFFYARAVATIKSVGAGGVGKATVLHALEGAFGGPTTTVADGDGFQIVFARLRIRVTAGLTPGATYKVTHPYGVNTFTASDTGTINFTENLGCGLVPPACNFANVLTASNIGPFLQWDPAESPPPAGFIGDPAINHTIIGSPRGTNFVRIDGPNIGGTGVNSIQTNLFVVVGKRFTGTGVTALTIDRTSYLRNATTSQVNVFVHSSGNATVTASGTGIPSTTLTGDPATGRFFARIVLGPNAAMPASIRLTASSPGNNPTTRDNPLIDEVTVDSATYNVLNNTLTITAHSSDKTTPPTLMAEGGPLDQLGTLVAGTRTVQTPVPPGTVTVTSSLGGQDSRTVDIAAVKANTTTTLTASSNPVPVNSPTTLTATVTAGTGTPTGTVTFRDGTTVLGSAIPLNASGVATVTTSFTSSGVHALTATYNGSTTLNSSTGKLSLTVQ